MILKKIFASDPRVTSATIDATNLLLAVRAADGTEYTMSPDNLFRQLQSAASAKDRADLVATYLGAALDNPAFTNPDAGMTKAAILPVLRPASLLDGSPQMKDVVSAPFAGDMVKLYVFDSKGLLAYVTTRDLQRLGLDANMIDTLALQNFQTRFSKVTIDGDSIFTMNLGGTYESSMMVARGTWEELDQKLGQVIVAIPARDVLVFTDRANEGAEAALRRLVDKWYGELDHPLTKTIFLWDGRNGWTALP